MSLPLIVDKPLVCGRGLPGRLSSHCSSIQHGRPTPSHRPALTLARCSAPADFASLRVLGAPAASRPPTLASSLAALPASLGLLRPVSATGGGLRAPLAPPPLRGFDGLTSRCFAHSARFVRPLDSKGSLLASGTADCLAHYARSASTSPFCKVICESKAISQPFCRNATGASPSAAS